MDFNINRALSECNGDVYVKKKLENVLKILEEIRSKKGGSVQYVRRFIGRIGRVYTIIIHLPVEIMCQIFLYLPYDDLLESRACFKVCRPWTTAIYEYRPFWSLLLKSRFNISIPKIDGWGSVDELKAYAIMRHSLERQNRRKKVGNPNILILNVEQEHSNVEDGVQCMIESYDYIIWLPGTNFVQISFFASSEKFFVRGENRVVISLMMHVDGRSLLHLKITLNYHKLLIFKETFEYLENLGVLPFLLKNGIISSPFVDNYKGERMKGDLQTIKQINSPTLTKIMFMFMGLCEVVTENNISSIKSTRDEGLRFEKWKLRKFILSDVTSWIQRVQFVVKTIGFREINLEEYLRKNKFFKNVDVRC